MKAVKIIDPTLTEVDFLRSELQTGLTLTKIASDATWRAKTERNRANARKAYDAVLRFSPRVSLSQDEKSEIKIKLDQLRTQLKMLGEEV